MSQSVCSMNTFNFLYFNNILLFYFDLNNLLEDFHL